MWENSEQRWCFCVRNLLGCILGYFLNFRSKGSSDVCVDVFWWALLLWWAHCNVCYLLMQFCAFGWVCLLKVIWHSGEVNALLTSHSTWHRSAVLQVYPFLWKTYLCCLLAGENSVFISAAASWALLSAHSPTTLRLVGLVLNIPGRRGGWRCRPTVLLQHSADFWQKLQMASW